MEFSKILSIIKEERKELVSSSSYVTLWSKWYKGKVPSFHSYYIYNGQKRIKRERLSMKMAKQVCEDWASLLMNEKVKIVVKDQDKLEDLLMEIDFWNRSNEAVEKGFALSYAALVVNLNGLKVSEEKDENGIQQATVDTNGAYVDLSVHTAFSTIPITWENGKCVECGFITEDTNKTVCVVHLRNENGTYDIYKSVEYKTKDAKHEDELTILKTESKTPFFVLIYPRITNNLELDSPLPISIFGNSIDTLKAIDMKYDSYHVEFAQGKKRTYVSAKLNQVDEKTGEVKNTFDPDDTVVYQLPESVGINGEDKPLVVNITDALRAAEHSQAIQDELNFLAKQTGLGVDYYRFEKGRVMTATQVISEKSDTFRNMKKHEGVLEKAITTLIKSLMFAQNLCHPKTFSDTESVEIQFDDSVIEDKTTEKDNDRKDMEAGIMSKLEFRMKWYGEDETTAKKAMEKSFGDPELLSRINAYGPALAMGTISIEEFVKQVYTELNEAQQKELIEELKSQGRITEEDLNLYDPNKKPTNEEK